MPAIRVRLFNAKFSPNLGDGLSCECLERALIEHGEQWTVRSVDLAARATYQPGSALRGPLLQALLSAPPAVRRPLSRPPLAWRRWWRWLPHYRRALADADAVVIGGGNLLVDLDLNFPTKLAAALGAAAERDLPVLLHGIGVGERWSAAGERLLREALQRVRVRHVGARDEASRRRFDARFAAAARCAATVVRDPGLLIARYVPRVAPAAATGIGITSAVAVRYHSSLAIDDERLLRWYAATAEALAAAGHTVCLFTNGSPEDVAFAERLLGRLGGERAWPAARLRPRDPIELAGILSSCALVVAFRMHALIAAYAYGSDILALRWDGKVESFMRSVGLDAALVSVEETPPRALVDLAARRRAARAAAPSHTQVAEEALRDVAALAAALRAN